MNNSQRDALRWILIASATFLLSLAGGWFLPNGLNVVGRHLGQPRVPDSALVRFFSFMLLFGLLASVELLVWVRRETAATLDEVAQAVDRGLSAGVVRAIESAVIRTAIPSGAATTDDASITARLLRAFGDVLTRVPEPLLAAYSVVIEDGLAELADDIAAAGTRTLKIDIQRHVEITRRLTQRVNSFTQINRRAFFAPDQWTQEWLDLVDELGARRTFSPEYIVLMSTNDLRAHVRQIQSMSSYLVARGWTLRCCDLERVRDALGGALPTEANIDVYGTRIAKLQTPPKGEYRGGIKLEMKLVDLERQPEIARFISAVRRFGMVP